MSPAQDSEKKSAFQNLPLEMCLGTMKAITLRLSFDWLHTFEGDKESSVGYSFSDWGSRTSMDKWAAVTCADLGIHWYRCPQK